jgi:hypothetical protein
MTAPIPISGPIPPRWGSPLTEEDYASLAKCGIPSEIADLAMLRRVDAIEGREVVGRKGTLDCAGILFSYYWPGDPHPFNYRLRRDNPEWKTDKDGKLKPDKKYLGAPGAGNRLYIPPGVTLEQLNDLSIPIALVEGEKKALALWRLAKHESEVPRFIPVAIAGVWNWRGIIGKAAGRKGERVDVKGPIPDLGRIAWAGRKVFIIFDSNVHTNDSVKWARKGIARLLATREAKVEFVNLPEDCGVNGVDDLLAAWGPKRVLDLFDKSVSGARLEVVLPPQFQSKPEGLFRTSGTAGLSQVQLTNYQALITTNIVLDDGVETKREFELEAELMGGRHRFTILAAKFSSMDWPIEQMGPQAITYPNQKDYARTAIQWFSLSAEERRIYTHTGWRSVDGRWVYLHAGGAVGGGGAISDVNVSLASSIGRYELHLPADDGALAVAVRASLKLAELGSPGIAFPLLAATYRSVLGQADFAIHLAGETGAFKSELAALHQQHFGAAMDRKNLPGSWSSTGNALESLAFYAKDSLFVIDDFAPQGSSLDVARYHGAADRVFRAAGNHAGRSRLDSTAKLRENKPPRALILSTGEDVPRGQSIRARLLILELSKGSIEAVTLTECQENARRGLYAEAMGAFVRWIAGRYEEAQGVLGRRVLEHRAAALRSTSHARTPDIVANLQAGFEIFLEFAVDCGAIDAFERERLVDLCWEALSSAAAAQAKHQAATEPTERFSCQLRSLLSSGRAHLEARNGGKPNQSPVPCGWRLEGSGVWSPLGDCVGWVDGDDIYLDLPTVYRLVQVAGRDAGEVLTVSEQTLKKRLHEKGLLAAVDDKRQTLTVRRRIAGSYRDVLYLLRNTVLPDESDEPDTDDAGIKD